jgi:chromosome segregation ATPase
MERLIEPIYQALSTQSAKAQLYLENIQEPYLQGTIYTTTPPHKRFIFDIHSLSGGEKTISQLALLFAISLSLNQNIILFDEIDAHLDSSNILKIIQFFNQYVTNLFN